MPLFQKKSVPKKLNIREVWQLYRTLRYGLNNPQEFMMDEVIEIMSGISVEDFKSSLKIMYKDFDYFEKTPVDIAMMFVRGIKVSQVVDFSEFIRTFTNVSAKR